MSFDPKVWTSEKPDPSKWYWFDAAGIGPHVDCRSKMSDGFVRSIHPIPSAERIAALVECERPLKLFLEAFALEEIDPSSRAVCRRFDGIRDAAFAALSRLEASRG